MGSAAILQRDLERVREFGLVHSFDVLPKGHMRLETAFRYPDGSTVDLFIRSENGLLTGIEPLELTDFGYTLNWLAQLGINPLKSQRRQKLVNDILHIYNIKEHGTALKCRIDQSDLATGIIRLGQACIRIADLAFTARFMPHAKFEEEVEDVLDSAGFRYENDTQITGREGNLVKVDFRIHGQKTDTALMLLSAETKSQITANNRANRVFVAFFDLQDWSGQRVAALDDRAQIYRDADLSRIENVATLIPFSERDLLFQVLSAA